MQRRFSKLVLGKLPKGPLRTPARTPTAPLPTATIALSQHYSLRALGMTTTPFHNTPTVAQPRPFLQLTSLFSNFKRSFQKQTTQQHQLHTTTPNPTNTTLADLNILSKNQFQSDLVANNLKITSKVSKFTNSNLLKVFLHTSRRHALRSITVAAYADELGKIQQTPRDWGLESAEMQQFHDELVKKKLPFTDRIDIEFLLKPETTWSSDSIVGLIQQVVTAPWDAMLYLYDLCRKVYLRITKKNDMSLAGWVYHILDLKVPLQDFVFDISQFSPEEHQLYELMTSVLRYQLVLEIAMANAIARAPFPRRYIKQIEEGAERAGLGEEEFKAQVRASELNWEKQKIGALKALNLANLPPDFFPDAQTVDLLEAVRIPKDLPLEELIGNPELVVDFIRNYVTDQMSQIPIPQMPAFLEFKGLASALHYLSPALHYGIYQRHLKNVTNPDHALRREIRQFAIKGTPRDYEEIQLTINKQLQHMRRVIKTYQRQQSQLETFGFIVKRKENFTQKDLKNLSKMDQTLFMQDMEQGLFLTIDDVDPEEEAQGSLIDEEIRIPMRYRETKKRGASGANDVMNKRRDERNQQKVKDMAPLNENQIRLTLRLAALNQEAVENNLSQDEIDQFDLNDESNDEALLAGALDEFDGSVSRLEQFLRPAYYDMARAQSGEADDDEYYGLDDYDQGNDGDHLDPLRDEEYDDETYLNEHLIPMRNRDTETDEERIRLDREEENRDKRQQERKDRYRKEAQDDAASAKSKKSQKNRYRELPAHVVRDNNPKIISDQWYNDAMKNYGVFQQRLATIERLVVEKNFHLRSKYVAATHYFAKPLVSETAQLTASNAMQKELGKHVVKMFESLPQDFKNEFFERRHQRMERQEMAEKRRAEREAERAKLAAERAAQAKIDAAAPQTAPTPTPTQTQTLTVTSSSPQGSDPAGSQEKTPPGVSMTDNIVNTPDGDVVLGKTAHLEPLRTDPNQEPITLNSILNATDDEDVAVVAVVAVAKETQSKAAAVAAEANNTTQTTSTTTPDSTPSSPPSSSDRNELGQKSGISYAFATAKNLQEEMGQWDEMVIAIQQFQAATHLNQYMNDQMQTAFERAQRRVMEKHSDVLDRLRELQDEQGDLSEEELEKDADFQKFQQDLEEIEVRPNQFMRKRAEERAMQHTELPLQQQMQLVRMKGMSNIELYNSEMQDIVFESLRDMLQTALYDSSGNNMIEKSISNLVLSVLSGNKSLESYDAMTRFNHEIEDQLNKTRFSVGKLTSMHRKFILMQLQQEHNLNKYLPLGELPKVTTSFLGNTDEAQQLHEHENQFSGQDGKNLYPNVNFNIQNKKNFVPNYDEFYQRYKLASEMGVPIASVDTTPLYKNEMHFQDEAGDFILSEQYNKLIVSPKELALDLYDSRFEIVSSKHLFKQLTRVRDRRLRQLLEMIHLIGTDQQALAGSTKFHIKGLIPALEQTGLPERLVLYTTKLQTHRAIAVTLNAIMKELSSKRKAVVDRVLDFSRDEYDITLQYCMDLLQYHEIQLKSKALDYHGAQFKAMDIKRTGFKNYPEVWRPELVHSLSIKDLASASEAYSV